MQHRHLVFPLNRPVVHISEQLIHMIPTTKLTSRFIWAALTAVCLALLWNSFAPIQLGGNVSYAIVIGSSMQPNFSTGDLTIMRVAPAYQPGDVVIYVHPETGWIIHRVVGENERGYLLRGDNNGWVDTYQPTDAEIVGKLWRHLPANEATTELLEMSRQFVSYALAAGP
jgi:signal peptidase I